MELSAQNNVYGLLVCDQRVTELAQLLGRIPDIDQQQVEIKTANFDGIQKLFLRTQTVEFDGYLTGKEGGEFLFNGAVTGDPIDVCTFVEKIHEALRNGCFKSNLEVYDDDGKCIAKFDA